MGFLDELKDKAEEFGDKTQEGLAVAKDKAQDVIEDVKDRFDNDDDDTSDETAQASAASTGEANGPTRPAKSSAKDRTPPGPEAGQGLGEFGPVRATEP